MFEEKQLQKAALLFEHRRYAEAEKEYGALVTSDPTNGYFHSMLALCALHLDKKKDAERHAKQGIFSSPSDDFSFYVAAIVALGTDSKEAESFCYSAITLNPYKAEYYELKSILLLNKKEWQKALDAANEGLAIEAENIGCLNARAKALIKLDNKQQAYDTINEALYFDPDNAATHANLGWGLLEKSEHKKALEHFKQSLSIDPGNSHARAGMVEALKARYLFYRLFLRYAFWIGNLKGKAQWFVIIGFYIGSNVIRTLGDHYPGIQVITVPIVVLYTIFALTTWIITPLSNLFLRLNVYGRYALDDNETRSSNFTGISLLVSVLSGIAFLLFRNYEFLLLCILMFSMAIPIAGTFAAAAKSKGRTALAIYSIAMLLTGVLGIVNFNESGDFFNIFVTIYLIAFILYQWVANAIIIRSN
ncbi:hypothetical protein CNR22_11250 [Sphingobacteriaceae bacterium]|nr:hypothetical protein CNR22_11250 [Sphingobacteriaceae bacterium]